ncbi:transposase [Streptomyces syringium]|uniref:transposase n=1 Tax=Streptomyces syringium TaxID=76729 RepID=UPI00364DE4D5
MARGDLTDEQWAVLEPLLPRGRVPGRPRVWPWRKLIDGIRLRVRTGIPWRDVSAEYGPWGRVFDLFRWWQRDGTWRQMLFQGRDPDTLQTGHGVILATWGGATVARSAQRR